MQMLDCTLRPTQAGLRKPRSVISFVSFHPDTVQKISESSRDAGKRWVSKEKNYHHSAEGRAASGRPGTRRCCACWGGREWRNADKTKQLIIDNSEGALNIQGRSCNLQFLTYIASIKHLPRAKDFSAMFPMNAFLAASGSDCALMRLAALAWLRLVAIHVALSDYLHGD